MIKFHNQDIDYKLKNKTQLKKWIEAVVKKGKKTAGEINFIFCSDDYLLNLNQQYLNHNTLTDIITFDYSKEAAKNQISGDIFISAERVEENALKFGKTKENEMQRVVIHGVLHLLGYKDKTKTTKAEMTRQEDACLRLLEKM